MLCYDVMGWGVLWCGVVWVLWCGVLCVRVVCLCVGVCVRVRVRVRAGVLE